VQKTVRPRHRRELGRWTQTVFALSTRRMSGLMINRSTMNNRGRRDPQPGTCQRPPRRSLSILLMPGTSTPGYLTKFTFCQVIPGPPRDRQRRHPPQARTLSSRDARLFPPQQRRSHREMFTGNALWLPQPTFSHASRASTLPPLLGKPFSPRLLEREVGENSAEEDPKGDDR
jgi:hypothetical protein